MANKIGLEESEYTDLKSTIKECHQNSISQMADCIKIINNMNGAGNAIDTINITSAIEKFIAQLEVVKTGLDDTYSAHEDIITSFEDSIDNYDTCG